MSAALILAVLLTASPPRAQVPDASGHCVEGCGSSSEPRSWRRDADDDRSGPPEPPSEGVFHRLWREHEEAARAKRAAALAEKSLPLMIRWTDSEFVRVPRGAPLLALERHSLFCQPGVGPWVLFAPPPELTTANGYATEDEKRCVSILGRIQKTPWLEPEDLAFLGDQAATALAGGPLRLNIPQPLGDEGSAAGLKLAAYLESEKEEAQAALAAIDRRQALERRERQLDGQETNDFNKAHSPEEAAADAAVADLQDLASVQAEEQKADAEATKQLDALAEDQKQISTVIDWEDEVKPENERKSKPKD